MSVLARTLGSLPFAVLASVLVAQPARAQDDDGWRTIEIETTEVTAPDAAITPDGETLIFYFLENPSAELEDILDALKDIRPSGRTATRDIS